VTAHEVVPSAPGVWTLHVDRTLKGAAPAATFRLSDLRISACGDTLGAAIGDQVIFARSFSFGTEVIDAAWVFDRKGAMVSGSALGFVEGNDTVATVAAGLRLRLPDSATVDAPARTDSLTMFLAAIGSIGIGSYLSLRLRRRSMASGH
jgi:hypothetical protein